MARSLNIVTLSVLCLTVVTNVAATRPRYDDFHLFRVVPRTVEQLHIVNGLNSGRPSDPSNYRLLQKVSQSLEDIDVLMPAQRVPEFLQSMKKLGLDPLLLESNAQKLLDCEKVADLDRSTDDYSWEEYHELNDTHHWMYSLTKQYPEFVSTFVVGQSYEGREILGIKISFGPGRRGIFVEGGIHAREWISPATTTYIVNELLTSFNQDVRFIAENFDWYIVPHTNPDGFVYTHTHDRFWRKTRSPQSGGNYGVDPNRNWDFYWGQYGASEDPSLENYAGPKAFSEIETKSLAEFITTLDGELMLYISFHSYSQVLLYPYGHPHMPTPNYANYERISKAAVRALQQRYGTEYRTSNIHNLMGAVTGSSIDWIYENTEIPYTFVYELRPYAAFGLDGFKLCSDEIIPVGEEIVDSLIAMIKEIITIDGDN